MSQQEIVGEIDMDHGQKGGSGAALAAVIGVGGLAYFIQKILNVLNMDIDQIEDGIKKMIINILKDTMRNKITFPIQLQRERMMIVKDALEKAKKGQISGVKLGPKESKLLKKKFEELKNTKDLLELEAFVERAQSKRWPMGSKNKTGKEPRCTKFFGRPGRLVIIKENMEWKDASTAAKKDSNKYKLITAKAPFLNVKYLPPDSTEKEKKGPGVFYEFIHGIILDFFIEELIKNDGELPLGDTPDETCQKTYIMVNLIKSLTLSLKTQIKNYLKHTCYLSTNISIAKVVMQKNKKGGGIQSGGEMPSLFKKKCNFEKSRPHEIFDLLILLSSDKDGPFDLNWYKCNKKISENDPDTKKPKTTGALFYKTFENMKKAIEPGNKGKKAMNDLVESIFEKLNIKDFLITIIIQICDALETLNADIILNNLLENASDKKKKAYQQGCEGESETSKDGNFVHRDICDAFFSQSFWNKNFGVRIPYISHSLLQGMITKLGDFQRDGDSKIECSAERMEKDDFKDSKLKKRLKSDDDDDGGEMGEKEENVMQQLMGKLKAPPSPPKPEKIMENLPKEDENLGTFIDEVLKIEVIVEYLNELKKTLNCNLKIIDNMVTVKDTKHHDLLEANCTQGPKQKPTAQEGGGKKEEEKEMKDNIKMAVKIITSKTIFKALVRELKLNINDLNNPEFKKLEDKEQPGNKKINAINVLLIIFDILYNQSSIGGLGAIVIGRIQAEYKKNVLKDEVKLTTIQKELIEINILNNKELPEHTNNHKYLKELFIFLLSNLSEDTFKQLNTFTIQKKNGISSKTKKILAARKQKEFTDKTEKKDYDKELTDDLDDLKRKERESESEDERERKEQKKEDIKQRKLNENKKYLSKVDRDEKKRQMNEEAKRKDQTGGALVFHNTRKLLIKFKQIPCYGILNALIKDVLLPIQSTIGETKLKLLDSVPDKPPDQSKIDEMQNKLPECLESKSPKYVLFTPPCIPRKFKDSLVRVDLDPKTYWKNNMKKFRGEWRKDYSGYLSGTKKRSDLKTSYKNKKCKIDKQCFKKKKKSRDSIINYMENEEGLYKDYILPKKQKDKIKQKKEEEEKAASGGGSIQQGGKLIGQGTYGCVFKPHLLCNGNVDKKDKEHVSKLIVMRSGDDYRLKNEMEIGKIILKSKKYSKYFSPIISTCPIEFEHISDQDKYKCNSSNKYANNQMILAKLKKITGKNFIDTIENMKGREALVTFLTMYKDIMEGIKFLVQKKIIHYDIKWDNVLFDNKLKRGMIIDFGLSFKIEDLDFNSTTNLKQYFYGFWSKMDVWCIDIQYICFLLHINNDPTKYDIQLMVEECISKNSLFKSYLNNFFDFNKIMFYENCVEMLEYYQYKYPNFKDRIKYIVTNNFNTWDNYALSIMYLKQYDLILKEPPKIFPQFHKKFIKNILWKNIQPNPNQRLSVKNSLKAFNKLNKNIKPSKFLKLAKYA